MMHAHSLFAIFRLENVEHGWLWLSLTIAAAAVLCATYWGIARRSQRRFAWALMGLRGVGLLALLLALAKPTWTRETETVEPGRLAVVVDNSLSMSLADPSGQPRYARARVAVDRLRQALDTEIGARTALDLFDINGQSFENGLPNQPKEERTDLAQAITNTTKRLRSRLVLGLVLISDGMDNTGRQDFRNLGDMTTTIYTLGFQAETAAGDLDLAVRKVQAPARVMVHNTATVEVLVAKTGGPATEATVVLKRGKEIFTTEKVRFGSGNAEQQVSLMLKPSQPGTFVFTAAVEAAAGERNLANNAQHFPLRVDAEPIRVLYREGFLRYEFKFLKNRLQDDPDVNLDVLVRAANADLAGTADALTAERLKNIDIVILGDMEASYLSAPEYQALVRWLDDKNHALLVLGGYRSFGPDGFRKTPLADVLPVVFAEKEPFQREEPFVMQLTEVGQRHPIFGLTNDRVKDMATWNAAPQLQGASLVLKAKPGAEVLAINPNVRSDGKPGVVVAVQRYGGGHTMILTADTTWRWSRFTRLLGQADTLYARFWSQTLRWLAGRSMDQERPLLTVSTDRPDYTMGKPVKIRVVRHPRPDTDLSAVEPTVEVTSPGGKTTSVAVRSTTAEPDEFTGEFYAVTGGRYEALATLTATGKPLANQTAEFLVQGADLELADTGVNPGNLQAIAAATGGRYFDIGDVEKLIELLPRQERRTPRIERTEYWNSPWLFFVFLAAVTAEWVLRRRNQLV